MKNWEQEAISSIFRNFDFKLCRRTMVKMNFRWGENFPTVAELKKEAYRLLTNACEQELHSTACGRFYVTRDGRRKHLRLFFYVDMWDNF
jgi:hypothetical protein